VDGSPLCIGKSDGGGCCAATQAWFPNSIKSLLQGCNMIGKGCHNTSVIPQFAIAERIAPDFAIDCR
jgi:hypothetical protein